MQKIMLAVGHKAFEETLIKKIKDKYTFTGVAPYREAILAEAVRNNPDVIVIRENLDGYSNMSDIVYSLRDKVPSARIIFIATDRQAGDEFLATLVSYGVYDIIVGTNINIRSLIELIEKPNTFSDVSVYSAKVTVDETSNRKVFETKFIPAPTPVPVETPSKSAKPKPLPVAQPRRNPNPTETIDEAIPLVFAPKPSLLNQPASKDPVKKTTPLKYDNSFYSPDDILSKTSKPIKINTEVDFEIEKPAEVKEEVQVESKKEEFDFEIVDEQGNPVNGTKNKSIEPISVEPDPVAALPEPVVERVKPVQSQVQPTPIESKPLQIIEPVITPEPVIKTEPPVVVLKEGVGEEIEEDDFIYTPPQRVQKPVVEKPSAPVVVKKEEPKVQPLPAAIVKEVKVEERVVAKEAPVLDAVASVATAAKRNKFLNGYPIRKETEVLLFVRTEEFAENHTALNVAVKLAKDGKQVLFVETAKASVYDYFAEALATTKDSLVCKKECNVDAVLNIIESVKNNPVDTVVIDTVFNAELRPLLMLNAKRFLLIKQNKPWIQNVLFKDATLSVFLKFFVLAVEEYSETGFSPKAIMAECKPFGIVKVRDRKEMNFFAINAKLPAMMTKKNADAIDAYLDIMNYIYGKGEDVNE